MASARKDAANLDTRIDFDKLERWLNRKPIERTILPKLPRKQLLLIAQVTSWQYDREHTLRKLFARLTKRLRKMLESAAIALPALSARAVRAEIKQIEVECRIAEAQAKGGRQAAKARKTKTMDKVRNAVEKEKRNGTSARSINKRVALDLRLSPQHVGSLRRDLKI